jgi:hypothetical protein
MLDDAASSLKAENRRILLASIALVVAFALSAVLALRGSAPPPPLGADAPADVFSSQRARAVLERILGDQAPHPTGSAANAAVRDRIVAEFARLGLEARVQRRFVCGTGNCADVDNIVARLPGASRGNAVLLSAHYDSVAAGPGASDDGAGVAALLEVVRALQAGPTLPRDVIMLVNDGEELDLLGAEAFVREPEFAEVATVVNLEARGTTGASLLIETQPGNAAVVAGVGRALARPASNSLDYEIYKALPNDTDFTVYRREGRSGVNFAWAQGAARYHTPLDDLAHLDPGSLQHHGDNMLGMARELAAAQGDLKRPNDAVFFNVFGRKLVSWPVTWNPALLALGLIAWAVLAVRLVRSQAARPKQVLFATLVALLALVLATIAGWGMQTVLAALGATPAAWTAQESHLVDGFAMLALAVLALLARPMMFRFGAASVALASLVPFALIAIATQLSAPGAGHMGLLPLVVGAVAGNIMPKRAALWAGLAAIVAAMLWFPYAADIYGAIGAPGLPVGTLLLALALLPLLPALAGLGRGAPWLGLLALAGTLAFATLAVVRPAFDEHVPRAVNLLYVDAGGQSRVYVDPYGTLPPDFARENGFAAAEAKVLPWSPLELQAGPKGPALSPPTLELVRDTVVGGRRQVQLRLRSTRAAMSGGLRFPGTIDLATVRIDGQPMLAPRHGSSAPPPFRSVSRIGLPPEGVLIAFEAEPGRAIALYGVDSSRGLPAALANVARARDAIGVPIHGGDASLAWTKLVLPRVARGH